MAALSRGCKPRVEEQDVYCAQFVNLKIFTFVLAEKTTDLFFLISKYDKIQHIYKRPL